MPRRAKQRLTDLTPKVVDDDSRLGRRMDRAVRDDREIRRLTRQIMWLQKRLRARTDDRAWQVFLRLESAVSYRAVDTDFMLVRWAFDAGVRYGSRR